MSFLSTLLGLAQPKPRAESPAPAAQPAGRPARTPVAFEGAHANGSKPVEVDDRTARATSGKGLDF